MKRYRILTLLALCSAAFVATLPAQEAPNALPSQAEMWKMIQAQQQQIEALTAMVKANQTEVASAKTELASAKTEAASAKAEASQAVAQLQTTQQQIEATSLAVEEMGDSAFNMPAWYTNTSVGGYGELHANFNNGADNEIDFHRFVLFFNHEYNDWISLFTEFELEHSVAGDDQNGEVELEQAFIRMAWTQQFNTDAGVFLMPVGILNETHEPNTFYGVERNRIESNIIPSTWWEGGIKGTYRYANGISVDGAISSGLDVPTTGDSSYRIRSGRQKVSEATNDEAALAGRIKYTGIAGLELAASIFYQDDLAQSSKDDFSGLLTTTHAVYQNGGFALRALYSRWDLSGDINDSDAEEQYGYYIEPSYRWSVSEQYGDVGVYARYSNYEFYRWGAIQENEIYEVGINYWPTDNVVFKADYQYTGDADEFQRASAGKDDIDSIFNLGVGYQF
jgi:hypothetical protein